MRSNFERFFTPQLAARIANSADAVKLGGDKRPVAVLFSDIRGFTALSETMRPDDMARLLTEYFTEMVECVFRHDGTLDKFIGDAVMAQWGAPIGEPDDADKAMAAALEMMHELDKLNAGWRAEGRPTLQIGIGLNYGEAFAGQHRLRAPPRVHRHRRHRQHGEPALLRGGGPARSSSPTTSASAARRPPLDEMSADGAQEQEPAGDGVAL